MEETGSSAVDAFGVIDTGNEQQPEDLNSLLIGVSCLAVAPTYFVNNSESVSNDMLELNCVLHTPA